MVEFMNDLKTTAVKEAMDANIMRICNSVGIEEPTGTDKLLAHTTIAAIGSVAFLR